MKITDDFKKKVDLMRKSWFNCTVDELWEKRENVRYLSISILITGVIIVGVALEGLFIPDDVSGGQIITVFLSIMILLMGMEYAEDINRIDLWIYLKVRNSGKNGERQVEL